MTQPPNNYGLEPAPAILKFVSQFLRLFSPDDYRQRIGFIALGKLCNVVALLVVFRVCGAPADIPGWCPEIEASEQPFLEGIFPFDLEQRRFLLLSLPPSFREQCRRKKRSSHLYEHWLF